MTSTGLKAEEMTFTFFFQTTQTTNGVTSPRRQFDHGTMVFHCQPWLTMVDCGTTMVCDRGPLLPLTMVHGQPWSENVIVNTERTCLHKGT